MVFRSGDIHAHVARQSSYAFEYRITILGAPKTGKTSILNQFVNNRFSMRYHPTIEDHITHVVEHKGNMCVCLLVDTCGSSDFPAMRQLSIVKGNACMVVYSTTDRSSFQAAEKTVDEIKSLKPQSEDVKIIIVANKCDLYGARVVSTEEGEQFARTINRDNVSCLYFETSSKRKSEVQHVFKSLLDLFRPEEIDLPQARERRTSFRNMSLRRKSRKSLTQRAPVNAAAKPVTGYTSARTEQADYFSDGEILDCPVAVSPATKRHNLWSRRRPSEPISAAQVSSTVSQLRRPSDTPASSTGAAPVLSGSMTCTLSRRRLTSQSSDHSTDDDIVDSSSSNRFNNSATTDSTTTNRCRDTKRNRSGSHDSTLADHTNLFNTGKTLSSPAERSPIGSDSEEPHRQPRRRSGSTKIWARAFGSMQRLFKDSHSRDSSKSRSKSNTPVVQRKQIIHHNSELELADVRTSVKVWR